MCRTTGTGCPVCAGYLPSHLPQLPPITTTLFEQQKTNKLFQCPLDRKIFPVELTSYEWNFWLNDAPYSAPQWATIYTNEASVIVNTLFGSRDDTPIIGDANPSTERRGISWARTPSTSTAAWSGRGLSDTARDWFAEPFFFPDPGCRVIFPAMSNAPLLQLELPGIRKIKSGKVREIFDLGEHLLFVASDRISAFDCIMPNGIPRKGEVLTQISYFWFDQTASFQPNHLVSKAREPLPAKLQPFAKQLEGRSMIVKKSEPLAIECVVRGYLAGSGWKEYRHDQTVCGIKLPPGLQESSELPEPIFTPATKAETGHDENISFEKAAQDRRGGHRPAGARRQPADLQARPGLRPANGASSSPTRNSSSVCWTGS